MNWSTIGYVVTVMIAFVLAAAIMESTLDIYGAEALGYTMIILVVVTVSDIIRKRIEYKGKASQNEQALLRGDIDSVKKQVDEMKEYLTDLYIQQHNHTLNQKIEEP